MQWFAHLMETPTSSSFKSYKEIHEYDILQKLITNGNVDDLALLTNSPTQAKSQEKADGGINLYPK